MGIEERMDERIIEKVREHEILYNNTLPSYRDQTIRQDSWQKIGWELGMTGTCQLKLKIRNFNPKK